MGSKRDKRVDAYIARSADFAKPILTHLRGLVHKACPDATETMKWSFPNFDYAGSILCSMAAFKEHCSFGFWKASLMKDPHKIFERAGESGMGNLGKIESLADLPPEKVLIEYIQEAARLNQDGVKAPKKPVTKKPEVKPPDYFMAALRRNKKALKTYEDFSPSHKREYVEWVTEAKTDETRARRLNMTLEWMAGGKSRNWKYEKKK